MDMNKTNSSIDENEESLVGEVLSDDEVREKKQAIAKIADTMNSAWA